MFRSQLSRFSVALGSALALVAVACGEPAADDVAAGTANLTGAEGAQGADKAKSCHGTEPFWGISIDSKKVKWESADGESRTIENKGPRSAIGSTAAFASFYQGKTEEDANRFLNVIITDAGEGGCSDGMSDEVFPYSVSVLSGSELLIGCCK